MVEFFWVFYGGTGLGLNVVGFGVCFFTYASTSESSGKADRIRNRKGEMGSL